MFCSENLQRQKSFRGVFPKWTDDAHFLSTNMNHADMIWSIKTKDGGFLVCEMVSLIYLRVYKHVCCQLQPVFQRTDPQISF